MRFQPLLLLALLVLPLLVATAHAADISIWASCDSSGVFISVSSDTPFSYTIKKDGNVVDTGQAQSSYSFSSSQPGTYEIKVMPSDGSAGKWGTVTYDGQSCTCSGAAMCGGSGSGGGSGGYDDSACSTWCDHCPLPFGLNWICSLVCNLCHLVNGLKSAIEAIAGFFNTLKNSMASFGNMIIDGISTIGNFFASVGDAVIGFFSTVASRITGAINAIAGFFEGLANAVYGAAKGFFELITAPFRAIIDKLGGSLGGPQGMTWRQYLFLLGVALMVGGAFAGGRARILMVAGILIVGYIAFTDPAFVAGIVKSPYLVIAAGAVLLVYAGLRMRA